MSRNRAARQRDRNFGNPNQEARFLNSARSCARLRAVVVAGSAVAAGERRAVLTDLFHHWFRRFKWSSGASL